MPRTQATLKFFGHRPDWKLQSPGGEQKKEIISPPLEISVKAKDQVKLQVTDGVLQKVNP